MADEEVKPELRADWRQELFRCGLLALLWAVVLGVFVGILGFLPGIDSYFHVALAQKMAEHGLVLKEFPWATESVWLDNYFDKEWLFHVLIRVFIPFGKLAAGKITIVLGAMAVAVSMWCLLGNLKVKNPFWWLLLLPFASFGSFLERLTMCRPHVFSIAFLALCIAFMVRRRPVLLGISVALYALSHTSHWQVLGIVAAYDVLHFLLEENGRRRPKLKLFVPMTVPVVVGMVAGEVLHPNFPANIKGLWLQNVLALQQHWRGGSELYGMGPGEFRQMSPLFFALNFSPLIVGLCAAAAHAVKKRKRLPREVWFLALLAAFYLLMAYLGQRFTEYFVPMALAFLALYVSRAGVKLPSALWLRGLVIVLVTGYAVLGNFIVFGSYMMTTYVNQNNQPPHAEAAAFLKDHLRAGDIVFTESWSDPPYLFYGAPEQRYLVFLDPFFMYARDPKRFRLWQEIRAGHHPDPLAAIHDDFGARAVFMRAPIVGGQLRKYILHAQLEEKLGPPNFVSKKGDVVYLVPRQARD